MQVGAFERYSISPLNIQYIVCMEISLPIQFIVTENSFKFDHLMCVPAIAHSL